MRIVRLALSTLLALPAALLVAATGRSEKPVALVYTLQGEAFRVAPGGSRPLRLFERLPAGTVLQVGPRSRLALAFANGRRWELGGRARATLGPEDLTSRSGPARPLPRVPALPLLPAIRKEDRPGPRAGAVRIRTERIRGVYPREGAATIAGETLLRFQPLADAARYRIEVQDARGETVFRADAGASPVRVPPGVLRPGATYAWTVRTLDRPGAVARGEAELVTLAAEAARAREQTREVLETEGPGTLALLAEIDRSLGLLLEAREELRAALGTTPGDPALRAALADLERWLEDDGYAE